ncbi:MAG: DNA primase [Bacteroidota bacterium]
MIPQATIQQILEVARVEEVVGEVVVLKKRGVNLLGLCPFHSERTPSFTVSPAKGIYKCFGCGKAGDVVRFVMDHDQLNYPEALKKLALRYGIPVEEKEETPEEKRAHDERESLMAVLAYAQKYFAEQLQEEEGRTIGYSYFVERGFTHETITRFGLGYAPENRNAFYKAAIDAGYLAENMVKAGLVSEKEGRYYDRFAGRVIFPIYNLSSRVIGFGGRTLRSDKNIAKYVNSPETPVYQKSRTLYGMHLAKKSIIANDNCYLVEGYTDVISMQQAGIENVVASSGTSLTVEQIRQISRFTKNITILYDGDFAGIKASFRGIDMVLEEGMNVKVLLFPDGEDPDSFSRKMNNTGLMEYLGANTRDFISFKTDLLLQDTQGDPIKRAQLIREIVESISLIPDPITRGVYLHTCARQLEADEKMLHMEVNKLLRNRREKKRFENLSASEPNPTETLPPPVLHTEQPPLPDTSPTEFQEKDLIRILLNHGEKKISIPTGEEDESEQEFTVAEVIWREVADDEIQFRNPAYQFLFEEISKTLSAGETFNRQSWINHPEQSIQQMVVNFLHEPYELSPHWEERHNIIVETENIKLKQSVYGALFSLKTKILMDMMQDVMNRIKEMEKTLTEENREDFMKLLEQKITLDKVKMQFAEKQGRVIL